MKQQKRTGNFEFSRRLQELRMASGLTQAELAEAADISLKMLEKIENSERLGSRLTHQRLAKVLGVSESYLVYGVERSLLLDPILTDEDITVLRQIHEALVIRRKAASSNSDNPPPKN